MASASKLAHLPVGSGFRSSFSGRVVTVFGCGGTLGKLVVNRFGRDGTQIVAPVRGDDYYVKDLKVCGDLGQIHIRPFYLTDEESIYNCVKFSDVVVNAMGRQYDRFLARHSLTDVNVVGAERLARISKEAGVERFVHMSAVGATADHKSAFMRSKFESEDAVKSAFPEATILRMTTPIYVYDRFLRFLSDGMSYTLPMGLRPVIRGLVHESAKYPVHYPDVAQAVVAACKQADAGGRTYELVGPSKLSIAEMYELVYASKYQLHTLIPVPASIVNLWALGMHYKLFQPSITKDEITRFYSPDNPTSGMPGFSELDVTPIPTDFVIIDALRSERKDMYHNASYEDVLEQRRG